MSKKNIDHSVESRVCFEQLEEWVREQIQFYVQELLEDEVTQLLGRRKNDSILLAAAKVLHGRRYDEPSLRERIHYMYLLPHLYDCPALRRLLKASWGLDLVGEHDVPHESLAQPKHRMLILQKKADG